MAPRMENQTGTDKINPSRLWRGNPPSTRSWCRQSTVNADAQWPVEILRFVHSPYDPDWRHEGLRISGATVSSAKRCPLLTPTTEPDRSLCQRRACARRLQDVAH